MKKRLFACFLTICMIFCFSPIFVKATDTSKAELTTTLSTDEIGEEGIFTLTISLQNFTKDINQYYIPIYYDKTQLDLKDSQLGDLLDPENAVEDPDWKWGYMVSGTSSIKRPVDNSGNEDILILTFKAKPGFSGQARMSIYRKELILTTTDGGVNYNVNDSISQKGVHVLKFLPNISITTSNIPTTGAYPDWIDVTTSYDYEIQIEDIRWYPDPEYKDYYGFKEGIAYTMEISYFLYYDFDLAPDAYATVNGNKAVLDTEKQTISYQFPPTASKDVVNLEDIEIVEAPLKTSYVAGERFDKSGMIVIATYDDGRTEYITDKVEISEAPLKKWENGVKISYDGKSAIQNITVKARNLTASDFEVTTEYIYDGKEKSLTASNISCKYNPKPEIGTIAVSGAAVQIEPGSYDIEFVVAEDDYYDRTEIKMEKAFRIDKAVPKGEPSYRTISASGKTLKDVAITIGTIKPADGVITWEMAESTIIERNRAYTWIFKPSDTIHYQTLTGKVILWKSSGSGSSNSGSDIHRPSRPTGSNSGTSNSNSSTYAKEITNAVSSVFGKNVSITSVEKVGTISIVTVTGGNKLLIKADGTTAKMEWVQVDGEWYHFDSTGKADSDWYLDKNGLWYRLDISTKKMITKWTQTGYGWYYMDDINGHMLTGWQKVDGKWYYLNTSGLMQTGWQLLNGKWYFLNKDGDMKIGWLQTADGKWYYLGVDGACYMNTTTPDGYRVDENGAWIQ